MVDRQAAARLGIETTCVRYREFRPGRLKAILGLFSTSPRSILDTFQPEMAKSIEERIRFRRPVLVVYSQLTTAAYHSAHSIPSIFEELENGSIYEMQATSRSALRRMRGWLTWQKQKGYLRSLIPGFQGCTVVSQNERKLLSQFLPDYQPVAVLPNGVDLRYNRPGVEEVIPGRLVYTGALTYRANLEAVSYFIAEILPLIQKEVPEAELWISGAYEGVDVSEIATHPGVRLTGYLEDLRPLVRSAAACVVPLLSGGGTRLKILEALALGVPVVSTPKGAEGLEVHPGEHLLTGEDPARFAGQVVRLLNSPELRARLSENGRRLVEKNHDWEQIGSQFCQLAEAVGGKR